MAIEAWPAGLPVPQKTFNCQLRAGLANDQEYIYPQRTRTYPERSSVFSLMLTQTEFETLQTFYQTTLNGGGKLFTADWLEDGGFEYHRLRFLKPFEASLQDEMMWKVKMSLEIIAGVPFEDGIPAYWPCKDEGVPDSVDLTGHDWTGYTKNSMIVSGSSYYGAHHPWTVFDGSLTQPPAGYWLTSASAAGWVKIDFGIAIQKTVTKIELQANTIPEPNRMPKDFTIQGSNNDSDWDILKTVTGETAWGSGEKREFAISIPAAYRYYKVDITDNNGDTYLQIGELYIWGY